MAAFPMADFEALIASAKNAVVDITEVVKHGAAILSWAGVSLPFFASPSGAISLTATPVADPAKKVQELVDQHKGGKMLADPLTADWLSAIIALLQLLLERWLHPTPAAPTP